MNCTYLASMFLAEKVYIILIKMMNEVVISCSRLNLTRVALNFFSTDVENVCLIAGQS